MAIIHSHIPLFSTTPDAVVKKVGVNTNFGSGPITGLRGEYKCLFPELIILHGFNNTYFRF